MSKKQPHCQCLHEIENGLERTKHCRIPCRAQRQILEDRESEKDYYNHNETLEAKLRNALSTLYGLPEMVIILEGEEGNKFHDLF